jgi:hypothetical protein
MRSAARTAAVLAALTVASVLGAGPVAAQVTASGGPAGPGATRVTFTVARGCAGSPTTSLVVRLPEGTADVQAESPPGWAARVTAEELTWTGGRAPAAGPATFAATMRIPGMAGDVVFLPAVQACSSGELAWTAPAADPAAPGAAPRVELTVSYLPRRAPAPTGPPAPEPPPATAPPGPELTPPKPDPSLAGVLGVAGAVTLLAVVSVGILVSRRGGEP